MFPATATVQNTALWISEAPALNVAILEPCGPTLLLKTQKKKLLPTKQNLCIRAKLQIQLNSKRIS